MAIKKQLTNEIKISRVAIVIVFLALLDVFRKYFGLNITRQQV